MTGRLEGKAVFITGVARGQGRAHAVRFAHEGADVIGIDLAGPLPDGVPYDSATPDDLDETRRLVEQEGRRALLTRADVRDREAVRKAVDDGVAELGRLDAVIANAGVCIPVAWDETTPEMMDATLDINVKGVWHTVIATAPHLIAAGGGSITLISSYAGKKVQPFMVPYTTSKHAITGMTRAFAAELGKHDIRVNSIHPGGVATPMGGGDMVGAIDRTNATNPKLAAMGTSFTNQGYAEPEEIAGAAVFLASDEAKFISSEHLSVDGGAQYF
ncbi:mycofactocin-coupled SDR family oxidoreductase [Tomitella fengzijianii]|uniref:NAD(P)-dependent oxidoreductase n=1 Tax=Tomitella fengzijianii TaxID=2597660 RepID=A0A516X383_9ACTN|nr:mycofactocin-coupled SDR family oxidoreductase [Tomitella fengzijianii]QDQ97549.1 NAD(P)-dependent oxidoreductase [Tomitella fengzijianii]